VVCLIKDKLQELVKYLATTSEPEVTLEFRQAATWSISGPGITAPLAVAEKILHEILRQNLLGDRAALKSYLDRMAQKYVTEAKSQAETWSWSWHPVHGIVVQPGYHQHDDIETEHPEVYEDPKDPKFGWYPPAGFAKVDRRRRTVEFHDYSSHPNPKALEAFLKEVDAVGFKVIEPSKATMDQRKDKDWI
jgi:hypothetical protein